MQGIKSSQMKLSVTVLHPQRAFIAQGRWASSGGARQEGGGIQWLISGIRCGCVFQYRLHG